MFIIMLCIICLNHYMCVICVYCVLLLSLLLRSLNIHSSMLRGWRNTVGSLIETSWPQITGLNLLVFCANNRGVQFHRIRDVKQYQFNGTPPTSDARALTVNPRTEHPQLRAASNAKPQLRHAVGQSWHALNQAASTCAGSAPSDETPWCTYGCASPTTRKLGAFGSHFPGELPACWQPRCPVI